MEIGRHELFSVQPQTIQLTLQRTLTNNVATHTPRRSFLEVGHRRFLRMASAKIGSREGKSLLWNLGNRRRAVYRDVFSKPKIDAKTFVALNYVYAKDATQCSKDATQCYCESVQVQKVIPKADPTTFVVLDSGCEKLMRGLGRNHPSGYAKDREQVYFNGNALKKADSSAFVSLGGCFGRDASNIYFEDGRLPNADRQLWRRIGGDYSRDEQLVFWQHKVIKDAVPFDFRQIDPFDDDYAYDGRYFYCRNDKISQDEYVDALKSTEEGLGSLAENCSTGKWQQIMYNYDRSYREPDETLYRMMKVDLDQWLTAAGGMASAVLRCGHEKCGE